jgi:hypothetical protein
VGPVAFGRCQRIFLCAPPRGLVRTASSDYWRLRSRLGLTRPGEVAMIEKLGFASGGMPIISFGISTIRLMLLQPLSSIKARIALR